MMELVGQANFMWDIAGKTIMLIRSRWGGVLGVSMYVVRGEWRCIQGVSGRYKENRRLGRH